MLKVKYHYKWFVFFLFFLNSCKIAPFFEPKNDMIYNKLKLLPDSLLTTLSNTPSKIEVNLTNKTLTHYDSIEFFNYGNITLNIQKYMSSCDCVQVHFSKFKVLPRDSFKLYYEIDKSKLKTGKNKRNIVFLGNFKEFAKEIELMINLK